MQGLETPTAAPGTYLATFVPEVGLTPRKEGSLPQIVRGAVVDQTGRSLVGVNIYIRSQGGEGYTVTGPDGSFSFSLTKGLFTIALVGLESVPANISVDGTTDIQVVFRGHLYLAPVPAPTAPPPTVTPTLTPTTTPTATLTPTAIPTPMAQATATATTTATPTPSVNNSQSKGATPVDDQRFDWAAVMVTGAVIGGALFLVSAAVLLK